MTNALGNGLRLSCEQLESRENPAGNITAVIAGDGALYITGDAADNVASIQQSFDGDLWVFGRNGTLVNGQSSVYLGRGFVTGVSLVTGAGNDLIEIINLRTTGGIGALMGNENDSVAMYGVEARYVHLMMQGGDDIIVLDGVYARDVAVMDGGDGHDIIDYRNWGITTPYYFWPSVEQGVSSGGTWRRP